jgi:hypothetical protein
LHGTARLQVRVAKLLRPIRSPNPIFGGPRDHQRRHIAGETWHGHCSRAAAMRCSRVRHTGGPLWAALAFAWALACSHGPSVPPDSRVKLAFSLPDGLTITSVAYEVWSSTNAVLLSGTINTIDSRAIVSVSLALPAGTGDTIHLSAKTTLNIMCTGTSPPFDLVSGQTTTVLMALNCGGLESPIPGVAVVNPNFVEGENCPTITSVTVEHAQTSIGSTISVAATATDADAVDSLSYAWSPAGSFTNPSASSTTFTCTTAGAQTISLTVGDNHVPNSCTIDVTLPVTCL